MVLLRARLRPRTAACRSRCIVGRAGCSRCCHDGFEDRSRLESLQAEPELPGLAEIEPSSTSVSPWRPRCFDVTSVTDGARKVPVVRMTFAREPLTICEFDADAATVVGQKAAGAPLDHLEPVLVRTPLASGCVQRPVDLGTRPRTADPAAVKGVAKRVVRSVIRPISPPRASDSGSGVLLRGRIASLHQLTDPRAWSL